MTGRGASPYEASKKRRECGTSSRGRCALFFEPGPGWSHGTGRRLPAFLVSRTLWSETCRWREGVGAEGGSRAIARSIPGEDQSILRFARRFLYAKSWSSSGRQASIARISVGVQVKQFVHHLWVLCQEAESFLIIWTVGAKTSPPYCRSRR